MATTALISAADYLRTSYEPDAEFVDGRIEERSVGEREHSDLQRQLLLLLSQPSFQTFFLCNPELRVQVSSQRFRVPDLCLLRRDAPYEKIVSTPPLLCIEILSPEDAMSRTLEKAREFIAMGVAEVWIFNPQSRSVTVCRREGTTEHIGGMLRIADLPCELSVSEIFSVLPVI